MPSTSLWELQKAIYSALTGDTTLMGKITGVYDYVPQDTSKGYVVIGDQTQVDWSMKGTDGWNDTITIHSWYEGKGKKGVKDIMDDIYRVLHNATLTVTDFTLVLLRQDFAEVFQEADALTWHGVQRFRALTHN